MAGFIEVHPRNAYQGLLLVNVDDIKCVYQLAGDGEEKWTVVRLQGQGPDNKSLDVAESYEEVKRLISIALDRNGVSPTGFALSSGPTKASERRSA